MARNIKLTLAYDGTDFHGWQWQPGIRTVQDEVEKAARVVCRHPLAIRGASRTDAGVHARGQVAGLMDESGIPPHKLVLAIGHRLPPDVALLDAVEVAPDFDASRSAVGKRYRYRIHNAVARPVAELRQRYCWHVWYPLDIEVMRTAGARLVGTHDFAGFATAGSTRPTTVRTIFAVRVERRLEDGSVSNDPRQRLGGEVVLEFEGGGFLYNQVRNMVGTLFEIGRGHWPVERIDEILKTCDRTRAGLTAPAQGLCLERVWYESEANCLM
jgi:tRNA pseudouridine38-40 synthase